MQLHWSLLWETVIWKNVYKLPVLGGRGLSNNPHRLPRVVPLSLDRIVLKSDFSLKIIDSSLNGVREFLYEISWIAASHTIKEVNSEDELLLIIRVGPGPTLDRRKNPAKVFELYGTLNV